MVRREAGSEVGEPTKFSVGHAYVGEQGGLALAFHVDATGCSALVAQASAIEARNCDRSIGAPLPLKPIADRPDGTAGSGTAASEDVALVRRT